MAATAAMHAGAAALETQQQQGAVEAPVVVCALYKFTRLPEYEAFKPPLLALMEKVNITTHEISLVSAAP